MDTRLTIQYQGKTEAPPAFITTVPQFESAWHQPWSLPVRQKILPALAIALAASGPFSPTFFAGMEPGADNAASWIYPWSTPVRFKPAVLAADQPFAALAPTPPIVSFAYYNWLTEPVRFKPGLATHLQQVTAIDTKPIPNPVVLKGWYNWWSEPVRFKIGLATHLQQTLAYHPRILPTPQVTATMNALETNNDVFLGGIYVYDSVTPATSGAGARVSIIEVAPDGDDAATSIQES